MVLATPTDSSLAIVLIIKFILWFNNTVCMYRVLGVMILYTYHPLVGNVY